MSFTINTSALEAFVERFNSPEAHRKGAARAGASHVTLTQEAFDLRGVDPQSGAPGKWPDKITPDPKLTRMKNPPARLYDKTPRLQDTGALVGSIDFSPTDEGYSIGPSPLPYAAQHQFGAAIPITPESMARLISLGFTPDEDKAVIIIPQRQFIVLPEPWKEEIGNAYLSARMEG